MAKEMGNVESGTDFCQFSSHPQSSSIYCAVIILKKKSTRLTELERAHKTQMYLLSNRLCLHLYLHTINVLRVFCLSVFGFEASLCGLL